MIDRKVDVTLVYAMTNHRVKIGDISYIVSEEYSETESGNDVTVTRESTGKGVSKATAIIVVDALESEFKCRK